MNKLTPKWLYWPTEITKLFSPELHKCYFLYIHKQIRLKVPILLYFVGPKRPSGNCYISCFLADKTALGLMLMNREAFQIPRRLQPAATAFKR